MIRCCIFDADGTLLDSMPMWQAITYEYAQSKGVAAPEGLHKVLNRLSLEQCATFYQSLGIPGTREEIVEELSDEDITTRVSEIAERDKVSRKKPKVKKYDEVDIAQMSLFDTVKDDDVLEELKNLDVGNMTPIDALNTIYRLQNKLKNRW